MRAELDGSRNRLHRDVVPTSCQILDMPSKRLDSYAHPLCFMESPSFGDSQFGYWTPNLDVALCCGSEWVSGGWRDSDVYYFC